MTVVALRRPSPSDPRLLQRCLLLAVLLHVWLVLMFGNAAGNAAPGQGVWGSLTVKLLGKSGGDADAPPGETGSGTPRRAGAGEPGAAEQGRWNPQEVPPDAARTDDVSPAPANTATLDLPEGFRPVEHQDLSPAPRSAPVQLPAPDLPSASLGRLDTPPDAAVAPLAPAANLRTPSRPAEPLPQTAELPAPVNRLDAAPATPATATLPRPADLRAAPAPAAIAPTADLPPPVRRLEAPAPFGTATTLPRPADLRTAPAPAAIVPGAELPAPVRRLEAPAATATAALPQPADLRVAPAATPTLAPPTPLPSSVQRLESPTTDGATVTPLSRAGELRTPSTTVPLATALQGAQDLPAPVRRLEAADSAANIAPLRPSVSARTAVPAPGAAQASELTGTLPGQVAAPAGPARGNPTANPYAAPRASAGSPDAGTRLGPDLPSPPTAAASTPARTPLNLSLPRGEMSARRTPGVMDLIPPPPDRKSKLEQSVEDATKKDCRKAYEGMGLLAVVPLAVDAARDKGCKW
ncbi:hypothetical protein ACG04R_14070 [Roseateles sp. BYS78W]|uniref:Uncharacterized protein n=1 Tax=Pelomonas candidula TaxID=3299025 RepID=A0ABW7HCZ9_9BURK